MGTWTRAMLLGLATACATGTAEPAPHPAAPAVEAPAPSPRRCAPTVAEASPADAADPRLAGRVVVAAKADRWIGIYEGGALLTLPGGPACWPMGLAPAAPAGPKRRQGDRRTPEGWYRTSDKPWSRYALAIAVHYPALHDVDAAEADGRLEPALAAQARADLRAGRKPPQTTPLGGEILIHGGGASDWTLGCLALDDADLRVLREAMGPPQAFDLRILP